MNQRAEHAFRVRLATLAKSAEGLREQDGAQLVQALLKVMPDTIAIVKALEDTARTGNIPSEYARDYTFQKAVRYGDADKAMSDSTGKRVAMAILGPAAELARWIIRFKSIPKGQAKSLEKAAKPFLSVRRIPRKIAGWLLKNEKNITYLVRAFGTWPDKTEASPDKYNIGPFTIHNTLQLEGDDLAKTNKVIEAATKLSKAPAFPEPTSLSMATCSWLASSRATTPWLGTTSVTTTSISGRF